MTERGIGIVTQASIRRAKGVAFFFNKDDGTRYDYPRLWAVSNENPSLINFGKGFVLEPQFDRPCSEQFHNQKATLRLFSIDGGPIVIACRWESNDRFLVLDSGDLTDTTDNNAKPLFDRWRIGLTDACGGVMWIFSSDGGEP